MAAAEPLEEPGAEAARRAEPLFQLNRRVFKAYMLKESLERLWDYRYEQAMVNYLGKWTDQLRWQRLPSFQKLVAMLVKHLDGILNYSRTEVRFGVVEAVNGNIRMLINRGRGYQNLRYLLLKASGWPSLTSNSSPFTRSRKQPKMAHPSDSR